MAAQAQGFSGAGLMVPAGSWTHWKAGNQSFLVTETRHTHIGCADACASLPGDPASLACLDSDGAVEFVAETLLDVGVYGYSGPNYWFGLHQSPNDQGPAAGWKPAVEGCDAGYSAWLPGEPDDLFYMQDCAAVTANGGWRDEGCFREYPCICQLHRTLAPTYRGDYKANMNISRAAIGMLAYFGGCSGVTFALLCAWNLLRIRSARDRGSRGSGRRCLRRGGGVSSAGGGSVAGGSGGAGRSCAVSFSVNTTSSGATNAASSGAVSDAAGSGAERGTARSLICERLRAWRRRSALGSAKSLVPKPQSAASRSTVAAKLSRAGAARRRARVQVQMLLQVLGLSSFFWAFTPIFLSLYGRSWPVVLLGSPLLPLMLWAPAHTLGQLSLRPTDGAAVFGAMAADALMNTGACGACIYLALSVACIPPIAYLLLFEAALCLVVPAILLPVLLRAWQAALEEPHGAGYPPRRALAWDIFAFRVFGWCGGVSLLVFAPLYTCLFDPYFVSSDFFVPLVAVGTTGVAAALMLGDRPRAWALSTLSRLGSTREEREAALLAGLFSFRSGTKRVDVDELLNFAEGHFHTVPFDQLRPDDFVPLSRRASAHSVSRGSAKSRSRGSLETSQRRQTPRSARSTTCGGAALDDRSEQRGLGQCDAFISHSWHDPPGAKWEALCGWAAAFQLKHGRSPNVWLDRLCIDQCNIRESLACLPIFLAGCETLLVIAGPTYSSRLWCVMELFTFLKMGAPLDRIAVLPFAAAAPRHSDSPPERARTSSTLADVAASFASFDAARAQCAQAEDQQALLSVIEESFGSFAEFNLWARHLFDRHAQRDGGASKGEEEMTEMVSLAVHS